MRPTKMIGLSQETTTSRSSEVNYGWSRTQYQGRLSLINLTDCLLVMPANTRSGNARCVLAIHRGGITHAGGGRISPRELDIYVDFRSPFGTRIPRPRRSLGVLGDLERV